MNKAILSPSVQRYLQDNAGLSPAQVALKKSPFAEVSASELAEQIDASQRLKTKLPTWSAAENIYFPPRQNAEQCSSEDTAHYKASLLSGEQAIDLTGGFGVDAWAFAKCFASVDYCEMNAALVPIVSHNFSVLACANVTCHCGDGLDVLRKHNYDLIYLDPARRDEHNRKMVSFSDCVPNVVEHQDLLLAHADKVMIKASPMMDISLALEELEGVKEVHVVALKNECKELLFLLEKGYTNTPDIICVNLPEKETFSFKMSEERSLSVSLSAPQRYLYEPHSAVLKAGAFNSICAKLNLPKLHRSTHLYTSAVLVENFPGKRYQINEVLEYNKKKITSFLPQGRANIKTYNFPNTPQQVQKKLRSKDGGDIYLFGVKTLDEKYRVMLTTKV